MRLIKPKTQEYRKCLKAMIKMRQVSQLKAIRDYPNTPLQIVNEGDDPEISGHPLNFVLYRGLGNDITLFALNG